MQDGKLAEEKNYDDSPVKNDEALNIALCNNSESVVNANTTELLRQVRKLLQEGTSNNTCWEKHIKIQEERRQERSKTNRKELLYLQISLHFCFRKYTKDFIGTKSIFIIKNRRIEIIVAT